MVAAIKADQIVRRKIPLLERLGFIQPLQEEKVGESNDAQKVGEAKEVQKVGESKAAAEEAAPAEAAEPAAVSEVEVVGTPAAADTAEVGPGGCAHPSHLRHIDSRDEGLNSSRVTQRGIIPPPPGSKQRRWLPSPRGGSWRTWVLSRRLSNR